MKTIILRQVLILFPAVFLLGGHCGSSSSSSSTSSGGPPCSVGTVCADGSACEQVGTTTETACFPPVQIDGMVQDRAAVGIAAALVVALGNDGTPRSDTASTGSDGRFSLRVSVPRAQDGAPQGVVMLNASAAGYGSFPTPLRRALPIALNGISQANGKYGYAGELSTLTLDTSLVVGGGSIHGMVSTQDETASVGVLITVSGTAGPTGLTAISDGHGQFSVFNVPAGTYDVKGYAAGVQLTAVMGVVVTASTATNNVMLHQGTVMPGSVSGNVTPVAGGCAQGTSIVSVPKETLPPGTSFPLNAVSAIRGQVPRGLRAPPPGAPPNITGTYQILGVPDGTYEVLAAWENDPAPCVFDPSNIAGAFVVKEVTVPDTGGSRALTVDAFKITGAVLITGPGNGDTVELLTASPPTFVWTAYSSSKNYQVAVFDSSGTRVWLTTVCADASNSCGTTSVVYGTAGAGTTLPTTAPGLLAGTVYQWRVVALGSDNSGQCGFTGAELTDRQCISISEDLRGVFRTPP